MTIMNMVGGGVDDRWAEGTPLVPAEYNAYTGLDGFVCLSASKSSTSVKLNRVSRGTTTDELSYLGARYMNTSRNTYGHSLYESDIGEYLNVVFNGDGECLSNITTINPTSDTKTLTVWYIDPADMSGVAFDSLDKVYAYGEQVLNGEYTFEGAWTIGSGPATTATYFSGDYPKTSGKLTAVNGEITMVTFDSGKTGAGQYLTEEDISPVSFANAVHIFTRLNKQ